MIKFFPLAKPVLALSILGCNTLMAQEQNSEQAGFLEEISITGGQDGVSKIAGSAYYIGAERLKEFSYSDIQRIAREIPGVSIQIEDGYGLRPNISIRGVTTERSSRITLLEDNVLIAPAPYSAPSAYYFPTAGRMQAVEVVKGPAAITQGPYTIGGALNMVSTTIPATMQGNVLVEAGEDATYRVQANYGGYTDSGFGFLLETHQWQSDGFQNIDRSNTNTGLDVEDYMLKLAYAPENSKHRVELKLQKTNQESNQSYLGLTDADFSKNAYRRYGLSELDNIVTEHEQQILRYDFELSDSLSLSATAYNNTHSRNWYKTEGIDLDGSPDADSLSRTSWSNIVNDVNTGSDRDGFTTEQLQSILDGTLDTAFGSIDVRANNREYFSRGVQFGLNWNGDIGKTSHALELGARFHEDEEDRLQYDSSYQQLNGALVLNDVGELGAAGNRVQEAEAMALYIYDRIEMGAWMFTPGLRYEDIEQKRTRYTGGADRVYRDSRENDTEIWLPGFGVSYQFNDSLSLLGGVHKGFTAPTNSPDVNPEEALNYEFGLRYQSSVLSVEMIGFLSDYENLLGVCTASSGTDCTIGDAFNGDAATIKGLEFLLSAELSQGGEIGIPLMFTYTYTDGQFDTDIANTEFFGSVNAGDPIPYIPENQLRLSLGLDSVSWGLNMGLSYIESVCVKASCGAFEKTDDSLTLDITGHYQVNEMLNLYVKVENLTAEEDILGRHPYGARPNKGRTASLGLRVNF